MWKVAIYSYCVLLVTVVVVLSSEVPCQGTKACLYRNGPVCGSDGITYPSLCYLESETCGRVTMAHVGVCVKALKDSPCQPKHCSFTYRPVCGSDGRTYSSLCDMESETCGRIRVAYLGKCLGKTGVVPCQAFRPCFSDYRPVCGSDGVTYPNLCHMHSVMCGKKVKALFEGECPQD